MYCIDQPVTIEWTLDKTDTALSNLLVKITEPDGSTSFSALQNYVAPTETVDGSTVYTVTPDTEGLWIASLVNGTPNSYNVYSTTTMYVFSNDTVVEPLVYAGGNLNI